MPIIPLKIPKLGESVSEATIGHWYIKEGDKVEKNQSIAEIETDKINTEFIIEFSGIINNIYVQENQTIKIHTTIADLEISEEDYAYYFNQNPELESVARGETSSSQIDAMIQENKNTFLSPRVQKLAKENGLGLDEILSLKGSGNNGRISAKDVEFYVHNKSSQPKDEKLEPNLKDYLNKEDQIIAISTKQKTAGQNLLYSYQNIPQITTIALADVGKMVEMRNVLKKKYYSEFGVQLTYAHFCFYATLLALKTYPMMNSWLIDDQWIWKKAINLGFAISLKNEDLVVPNIKNGEDLNFLNFIQKTNSIIEKAKAGNLTLEDFEQCSFTCSNTGSFGSLMGTPIISAPQVAVLAFGEIIDDFILGENAEILPTKKMHLSLSYDHRVINGALASKFLSEIKNQLLNLNFI